MNFYLNKEKIKSTLKFKGIGNRIIIKIDPQKSINFLKKELNKIFKPIGHLIKDATIFLDIGENSKYQNVLINLSKFFKKKYQISNFKEYKKKIKENKNSITNEQSNKILTINHNTNNSETLLISGRIRSGQKINVKKHIILLGDVNPGGEIIAGGDVIILGSLQGKVIAGQNNKYNLNSALILAFDFRPIQIQINNIVANSLTIKKIRPKKIEFAYVYKGCIIIEDYLKSYPLNNLSNLKLR